MPESKLFVDFVPRWARNKTNDLSATEDTPNTGMQPPLAPKLPARIVPRDNGHTISAKTLTETVEITQKLLWYASYDAVHGVDTDFSDLRRVESPIFELGRLYIEPFESGSFVIPAELKEGPFSIPTNEGRQDFYASAVLGRFVAIMDNVLDGRADANVSIGALKEIKSLTGILGREADRIEFRPVGFPGALTSPREIRVDVKYLEKASSLVLSRQERVSKPSYLEGRLVAVDLLTKKQDDKKKMKVILPTGQVVDGFFLPLLTGEMVKCLNKRVRVEGTVTFIRGVPIRIDAISVAAQHDESHQ
jgi:hypothetical protein